MVRRVFLAAAVLVFAVSFSGRSAFAGQKIVVPGGTVVPIVVVNPISSSNANVGDTFAVQAQSDVVVNGWVAISKGAPGQATVTSVDRAGSHGHPGSLGI